MRRIAYDFLLKWKLAKDRKPLIVKGARQVGKTWLLKEFGRLEYKQCAYINFESNAALKTLFEADHDINRILLAIQIETGVRVDGENTLVILDEVQEAAGGLTALKYFQENAPQYHVVAAGSLLGVALGNKASFPVGKVDFMELFPLSFPEFLEANGDEPLLGLIKNNDWSLIQNFKVKYAERLKQYYFVGGMPEAALAFSLRKDFKEVRRIQKNILMAYEQDFSKHAPNEIVPRIRMLWNSIPSQLAKENRKFVYGLIRHGARAKDYEVALSWLTDSGLIHKVHLISKPAIPLKAYESLSAFKLFLLDVGLLAAMTDLDARSLLEGNSIFEELKGALTEQYVLQQLRGESASIYYWSAEGGRAEIDFLLQIEDKLVPVEVKASENLQAKSLKIFFEKYHPVRAVRTSMSDYREESWLINVPLYAINELWKLWRNGKD